MCFLDNANFVPSQRKGKMNLLDVRDVKRHFIALESTKELIGRHTKFHALLQRADRKEINDLCERLKEYKLYQSQTKGGLLSNASQQSCFDKVNRTYSLYIHQSMISAILSSMRFLQCFTFLSSSCQPIALTPI